MNYELSPHLYYYRPKAKLDDPHTRRVDLCVYGATPGGITAAIEASRLGLSVVLIEHGRHVGGVTASGLGQTDFGNKAAIGGLALDFYRRVGAHYGQETAWTFEPAVAEATFLAMLREAEVPLYLDEPLEEISVVDGSIESLRTEGGHTFHAAMWVDASYEGDLMAKAGVSFHVGREANSQYRETFNGINFRHHSHNFKTWVDPYRMEGDASSGFCWGITHDEIGELESGDSCTQAYNFRLCLTDDPANRLPFPRPNNYDPDRYELLLRYIRSGVLDVLGLNSPMPNHKTDCNNHGGFATDYVGGNYDWPNGDYARREAIFQDHVNYQAGLLWFLANDKRLPAAVREETNRWGLPKDEFSETAGWPWQLYVREARRLVSDYVLAEADCRGTRRAEDSVGLACYQMDSHNCRRLVIGGRVINEGNIEILDGPPYPIPMQSVMPRQKECSNLLVPVCLSASHIAFGSIRMEPVFMVLGQSCAQIAKLALERQCAVQEVPYAELQPRLQAEGQILAWSQPKLNPGHA